MQQLLQILLEPLHCAFRLQNADADPDSAAAGDGLNPTKLTHRGCGTPNY
jgi:hypothetical protein